MMTFDKGPSGRIRGLRRVLADMKRQDVVGVLSDFSLATAADYGYIDSTDFDLLYEERRYPPKAVLGLAAARVAGRPLTSDEFAGGEKSACLTILRSLDLEIVPKVDVKPSHVPTPTRYEQFDRESIAKAFEPEAKFSPGAGRWGITGIVETPQESQNFVIMVTFGDSHRGQSVRRRSDGRRAPYLGVTDQAQS